MSDLNMLVATTGGKERRALQWHALLIEAGSLRSPSNPSAATWLHRRRHALRAVYSLKYGQ
jgi:hypothetical protein